MSDLFKFAEAFGNERQPIKRRLATVVSVESDYTCTIVVGADGTQYNNVRYFGSVPPLAGAQVWVDSDGFDIVAVGAVAGFGGAAPVSRAYQTGTQNIATGTATDTVIRLDANSSDPFGMVSLANNRLVAPMTGYYLATANILWATNATGIREITLRANGSNQFARSRVSAASAGGTAQVASQILAMSKGDYVQAIVNQTSGGGLATDGTDLTALSLAYLGARA